MLKPTWRIYYDDGSTYDSTMGSPASAPSFGVLVVVCDSDLYGRNLYHNWDWYYFNGEWRGADIHGLLDQLLHDKKGIVTGVKQGRTTDDKVFESVLKKAINDVDFRKRTSKNKLETPIGSSSGVIIND